MNRNICVIGGGRWGENHIRTLSQMGNLAGIVETDQTRLRELVSKYQVQGFLKVDEAIKQGFEGYVLASPAETHYHIGKKLLEKGLNVLIEKPMTLSSKHSKELVEISDKTHSRLMVGHLLLFHPAIKKIKEVIENGKIGQLYYIYSTRLNFGTIRTKENVFWSFAPHDISILNYLIDSQVIEIKAKGGKFLNHKIFDFTLAQFVYPGNVQAHIFVSWLHPFKEQRLVVVGSQGMLSFVDSSSDKNIVFYNKRIDWEDRNPVQIEQPSEIIPYNKGMPLQEELNYFTENLDKSIEVASGKSGHEVVKVLEKVQELLR